MASTSRKALLAAGLLTGFASAKSPMALPESLASLLYDVRLDDDTLRVRWGGSTVASAIAGTQTYRGHFECVQNGVRSIFAAMSDGANHVAVYRSIDGGLTWASVSPSSGTYGDTRLTDVGPVYFGLVTERAKDYLVIQNGAVSPRIFDGTTFAPSPSTATGSPSGTVQYALSMTNFTPSATITPSNAGHFAGTIATQGGSPYLKLTINPSVLATDTVTVALPGGSVISPDTTHKTTWFIDSGNELWRGLKIESAVTTAGPWLTLYDPASSSLSSFPSDDAGATAYLAASDPNPLATGALHQAIRFTYVGDAPAAAATVKVFAVGEEGEVKGGTNIGAAYASSVTGAEGPGVIFPSPTNAGSYSGVSVPITQLLRYVPFVSFTFGTGFTALDFDRANAYVNVPGSTGYYFRTSVAATLGGSAGVPIGGGMGDLSRPLPRADSLFLPIGTAMATINDRLFLCSGNRLYYSAAGHPFQFALTVGSTLSGDLDALSAASFSKPGESMTNVIGVGSVLTGAESLGTPQSGAVSVYVATDITTYVLSGFDALSLNKTAPVCIGSRSPFSYARAASGGFFFLDSENQIRRVQGTDSAPLSRYVVDDQTRGIPDARLVWAAGAFFDERYHLAYTPQGAAANTRVLVYNLSRGFESIDRPEAPAQGLTSYYDPATSRTRLFQFTTVGLSEHSQFGKTTEPSGGRVTASVTFREQGGGESNLVAGDLTVVADPDPQGLVTFFYDVTTGTRTGTLPVPPVKLDPRPANAKRVARLTSLNVGADSLSVVLTMGLLALGGTRIYSVSMGVSAGSPAATR